jgi:argininosuccinate lyase
VEQGAFAFNEPIVHTHEGSIGNLCNEQVAENLHRIYASFDFDVVGKALNDLLL